MILSMLLLLQPTGLLLQQAAPRRLRGIDWQPALALTCAALLSLSPAPPCAAVEVADVPCPVACFKECDVVAPGNKGYCAAQCDSYCDSLGAKGYQDQVSKDRSEDSDTAAPLSTKMDNGIFGDSGVVYSKGVEDLFATAFGAKRQSKDVTKADVGEFASDLTNAVGNVILGGERAK